MNDGSRFDGDYFLRGQELGISGYTDYRWLPDLTIPMCCAMIRHLGIEPSDIILDFGCARGYTVRAFREMGYTAVGYDVSKWAIENCDKEVSEYLFNNPLTLAATVQGVDWIIAKDVLEHVDDKCLNGVVTTLQTARKGIFVVVPLGNVLGEYVVPEYEKDVTHIHRESLHWWVGLFSRPGWSVESRYRVCGVKDNYSQFPTGNGFIVCRRLSDS